MDMLRLIGKQSAKCGVHGVCSEEALITAHGF